jgi:hypothetical protein
MVIDSPCLSLLYAMTVYTIPFTPSLYPRATDFIGEDQGSSGPW